tara:strand:+ start:2464 stop:3030 length:567 start_codon:yes stop_codon:yes gene_type:complete
VDFLNKGNIMDREAAEKKRNKELVELRKKYLAKKGKKPAAKKKATKPKLTGREAVEAKRKEKLEALRIAAKTRKALKEDKKSTAPKKSVRPKARSTTAVRSSSTIKPQRESRRNVLSDFTRLDKYISDLDKKIKANSAKLNSSTKNKIDMEMKKLRRQGKNGFEKSGMFTKAQMDAAKKRINEMLKEK